MKQINNISNRPVFASRSRSLVGAIFLIWTVAFVRASDTENRIDKQLNPLPDAPAGEWWKASWREGWTYEARGDFSLSARARIQNASEVSWWDRLKTKAAEYAGELNLEVRGNSLGESGVLQKNKDGELLITRYYPRTEVNRAIFRKPVGDPTFLDKALDFIIDDKKRSSGIKKVMAGLAARTALVSGGSGAVLVGVIGEFVGDAADSWFSSKLKEQGIQKRLDGGIELDPKSPLLQTTDLTKIAADIANLAIQMNDAFNRRMFLISASAKSGKELDTREIYNEGKDLVEFIEKKSKGGGDQAATWLKSKMPSYNKPKDLVRGVFQRETFALSSQVFDAKERKPGDVWIVPADFFNSFLHPDLHGRFQGSVVLRYVRDAKVPERYNAKVTFDAREIEILYKGKIEGRTYYSTLEYAEPNFTAKLREDTEGVLFVDKKDEYLRQADLNMTSQASSKLPDMKILNGLEAVGDARFEVHYTCAGIPASTEP